MTVTETAVRMAVSPTDREATRPTRGPLISTSPTVNIRAVQRWSGGQPPMSLCVYDSL